MVKKTLFRPLWDFFETKKINDSLIQSLYVHEFFIPSPLFSFPRYAREEIGGKGKEKPIAIQTSWISPSFYFSNLKNSKRGRKCTNVAHLYTTIHTNVCIKVRLILDPKEIIKLTYKLCMYVLIKLSFHEHIESYWLNLKQSNICKLRTLPPPLKFLCLAVISKGINLLLWQ